MPIEKLIEMLQSLRAGSVSVDCSASIFDHRDRPSLDGHLTQYDGWICATIRIMTPPHLENKC